MFARAFTIAIALLLAACAQPVATEKLSSIHSVRVVSLVGDPVTVQAIGFTVFSNEERLIPAASWRIDDAAAARVGELLRGRFEVTPARIDPTTVYDTEDRVARAALYDSSPRFLEPFRRAVADQPADAYLLLTRAAYPVAGNQAVAGLGLLRMGAILGTRYNFYAAYTAWLIDGRSFVLLGRAGSPREMRPADATKWADVTEALTPEQAQRLAGELKQLMSESLPKTLGDLNLR